MKDYIPRKDNDLLPWANNLSDKIDGYAEELGLTADEVTLVKNSCTGFNKGITDFTAANTTAKKAAKEKTNLLGTGKSSVRTVVQRMKKSENFTPAISKDLNISGSSNPFNPDTYKTKLTTTVLPGKVNVKFIKKGAEGVNMYSRINGSDIWVKLDFASRSPYADKRPLVMPGTAELRQYMAIGVIKDEEIGLMSDISEVVFGR